eukprot:10768505-Alexandrium_andersonii.AAC.1
MTSRALRSLRVYRIRLASRRQVSIACRSHLRRRPLVHKGNPQSRPSRSGLQSASIRKSPMQPTAQI